MDTPSPCAADIAIRRPPLPSLPGRPTVILDMDGTILDRHFDDHFWEVYLPGEYGRINGIPLHEAREELLAMYREREGSLDWTDLDYWSQRLGLDVAALKMNQAHMIAYLPHAEAFLNHCRETGKRLLLATDAHPRTLEIKQTQTGLDRYFDRMICAAETGWPKRDIRFWRRFFQITGARPEECVLADDSPRALAAAAEAGIGMAVEIRRPSSRGRHRVSGRFHAIDDLSCLARMLTFNRDEPEKTASSRSEST